MATRLLYLEKFHFPVIQLAKGAKVPPEGKAGYDMAKDNPSITGNAGAYAGGWKYEDGYIVVVDLDYHPKKSRSSGVDYWREQGMPTDTLTVETPNDGFHLYFLATDEQLRRIKENCSHNFDNYAIDLFYDNSHYVCAPESVVDGKEYTISNWVEPAPFPDRVIDLYLLERERKRGKNLELAKESSDKQRREVSLNKYERELVMRALEDEPGLIENYDDWLSMMAAFKNSGFDVEDFKRVSWQDEKTQRGIEYKWKTLTERPNEATFGSIVYRVVPQWNDLEWRFNKVEDIAIEYAVSMYPQLHKVLIGKDVCIIDESVRDKGTVRDYKNAYACYQDKGHRIDFPVLNRKEKKITLQTVDSFPVWFKNAPLLEGRVCEPDYPFGEIEQNGKRFFNDWEEPTVRDGEGTTDLFWQHIKENICDGSEECFDYFRNWIYDLIANPLHRNGVAVALSGNQGCGKSIVGNILSRCFHPKYCATINNSGALMDKFDAGWKNAILVNLEESTFAGDRKNGVWSKMKDLITSESTTVERKGVDVERIRNKLHFLITSNESYVVPKQQGDRRYLVLHCNDNRRCDSAFFGEMVRQMENGGIKKLIGEARSHREEVLSFNYLAIPETEIGAENALETAPMALRVLVSKIEDYNPENGDVDMPFFDVGGEILVSASKLIDCLPRKDDFITTRRVGRQLREWLGRESEDRRVSYPIETKVMKVFPFCSIDELKRNITLHGFHGLNIFK